MSFELAEHDRMLAAMILPCTVEAVDLAAKRIRVRSGEWVSGWVRWHALAAGKARHWRAPSLGEQGTLISPSGQLAVGTFIPGLFGDAGDAPDNRDHVEVWRFDDGASLTYDWEAHRYSIILPQGEVLVQVGATSVRVTEAGVSFIGPVSIDGPLHVTGNITSDGSIMDAGGNSNHHSH